MAGSMKKGKRWIRRFGILAILLLIYPVFVLGYTWTHVFRSDFEGGRNGPLDAYRHALASAVVSHTLGEWAVELVTTVFESSGQESGQMDRKNNSIGAAIGQNAKSLAEIEPTVRNQVSKGAERSDQVGQITWLPRERWSDARLW